MFLWALFVLAFTGFTGQEVFVELEGYINGRSSIAFRSQDRNIRAVLPAGTRGQILQYAVLPSGNYALKIKALNTSAAGNEYWIYYKRSSPAMRLFANTPQHWLAGGRPRSQERVRDVTRATAAETTRETTAYQERSNAPAGGGQGGAHDPALLGAVVSSQVVAQTVPAAGSAQAVAPTTCRDCTSAQPARIAAPTSRARMAAMCSNMIRSDGTYGDWGRQMASILAEPRYRNVYLRNDSLGVFCPKFAQLSESKKIQAWVWFWMALGQEESNCNLNQFHGTHYRNRSGQVVRLNPREGHGIWALEKSATVRRSRGSACSNISSFAGQARCSVDIMARNQLDRGYSASHAPESRKYWGPTRNGRLGRHITPHMRRFTECF
jgi:hypothetical protein